MSRYTADSRDRVLDAVDMIALVSTRTELSRRGVNSWFGRCPFHEERTGSFHVRPEEKHYYCFGCQASGDPFDFVRETEGLDFRGSLESLAERFGVALELEDEDPAAAARRERRERLHQLLGRAADYYARVLWESNEAAPAREYLARRGLADATLRTYRVGYAPSAWDKMLLASRSAGFSEDELLATGLAQRSTRQRGSVYDRFRERIMFPLSDARGRVVGFGARAMRDNQQPKYLNTSEGEVFHKGSQLFGIDLARRAASRAGSVVLAEGYTDVLALHQAGLENAVGVMGTSLTDEQARELERTARTLVLALDADGAGQEAMLRAARVAAGRNMELRVVPLPAGTDPADLIQRDGPEPVAERIRRSAPFISFHVERILQGVAGGDAEEKGRAIAELGPMLAEFAGDPTRAVLRDELRRRIADRLALSPDFVGELLASGAARAPRPAAVAAPAANPIRIATERRERAEREFLSLCVKFPNDGAKTLARIDPSAHFTGPATRRAAAHLAGRLATPLDGLPEDDPEVKTIVAEAAARAASGSESPASLEVAWLSLEFARLERAIAIARSEGTGSIATLSAERGEVRRRLGALLDSNGT